MMSGRSTQAVDPIAATLERVSKLDEYLAAETDPAEPGAWTCAAHLPGPGASPLDAVLSRVAARLQTSDRRVLAALFMCDYTWRVAAPAVASYLAERRVPDLAPASVLVRFDDDGLVGPPAYRARTFATLASDTDAGASGAVPFPDPAALLTFLRESIEAHLSTTIAAVRARSPLGIRAQWALAADSCAEAFLWAGTQLGEQDRAQREAEALLSATGSPLRSKSPFLIVEHAGRRESFVSRSGCCLSYRLREQPHCATCPLLSAEERNQRLQTHLECL